MTLFAHDVCFSVPSRDIVAGITLEVKQGETLGLIGPNGSGKSTLLKMLSGIRRPSTGHITLNGDRLERLAQFTIAQNIALVEQQADTGNRITVRDAVELGRTPWLTGLTRWGANDDMIVAQAIEDVDMSSMADRYWHSLSGGERQRVHIARALAQRPRILLLDEPTNHLDIHHQLSILSLVAALPVTVIVALHDLNQAMTCDRVGVMSGGRLIALGTPQEVITNDCLGEIFGVKASFLTDPEDGSQVIRFSPLAT